MPDLRTSAEAWSARPSASVSVIPLTLHVATDEGTPVAARARVARWVRRANEELRPYGIEVDIVSVRHLPQGWASVTRWADRRTLAHYAPRDGTIHVFVVEELDSARQRSVRRRVRGLHWRYRGLSPSFRAREYVVVTKDAPVTTFAHELGHLFGLRHSLDERNIMCSCRRGSNVWFSTDQGQAMRSGADRFLARQAALGGRARAADRATVRRRK